ARPKSSASSLTTRSFVLRRARSRRRRASTPSRVDKRGHSAATTRTTTRARSAIANGLTPEGYSQPREPPDTRARTALRSGSAGRSPLGGNGAPTRNVTGPGRRCLSRLRNFSSTVPAGRRGERPDLVGGRPCQTRVLMKRVPILLAALLLGGC